MEQKRGNFISIEHLFKTHYARLCYFAFQLLHDNDAAEDTVQEVFIKYWANKNFENDNDAKKFLYASVKNACLNIIRHNKVEQKFISTQETNVEEAAVALNAIIKSEVLGEIYTLIEALPEGCRTIFKMSYFEGMQNQKIADALGVSINTVKTQKQRALQLLRIKLGKDFYLFICIIAALYAS